MGAVLAPSAAKARPCENDAITHLFDGYRNFDSNTTGAKGNLRDRHAALCVNTTYSETSASGAWIMLSGYYGDEHAQIGFFQRSGMDGEQMFTEWARQGDWDRKKHYGIFNAGTVHGYRAEYVFESGKAEMRMGGSLYDSTPFDPALNWASPWHAFFSGETWDRGDDMPGTPQNKTHFTQTQVRTCRGCSYHEAGTHTFYIDNYDYDFQWVDEPTDFNIWTKG